MLLGEDSQVIDIDETLQAQKSQRQIDNKKPMDFRNSGKKWWI